jgi:hypothetical protein
MSDYALKQSARRPHQDFLFLFAKIPRFEHPDVRTSYDRTRQDEADIRKAFETPRELFPDLDSRSFGRRFNQVRGDYIEARFPQEASLREQIRAFSGALISNQLRHIFYKRLLLFVFVLAAALTVSAWAERLHQRLAQLVPGPPALGFAAYALVVLAAAAAGTLLFVGCNAMVFSLFKAAVAENSSITAQAIQNRLSQLRHAFKSVLNRTHEEEHNFAARQWSERADWWTMLALWFAERARHIESAFELEMWRVHRFQFLSDKLGSLSAFAVAALALGLAYVWAGAAMPFADCSGLGACFSDAQAGVRSAFDLGLLIVLAVVFAAISMDRRNSLPRRFVRDHIDIDKWERFAGFRYHRKLAHLVSRSVAEIGDEKSRHKPA